MASQRFRWDGVTQSSIYNPNHIRDRVKLFEGVHINDWDAVLAACRHRHALTQLPELDTDEQYTILHYAVLNNVPEATVSELVELGAYRNLPSALGKLSIDLLPSDAPDSLHELLSPITHSHFPSSLLAQIENVFHQLIQELVGNLIDKQQLRLPPLAPMLETSTLQGIFTVPKLYGNFAMRLMTDTDEGYMVSTVSSRVVGYSGKLFKITTNGHTLLAAEATDDRDYYLKRKEYF